VLAKSRRKPKRTVAVTGASGQLGRLILRRLIDDRSVKRIIALDLVAPNVVSRKVEWRKADIREANFERHLDEVDVLMHLAFVVTNYLPREEFDDINVRGSKNVFAAAATAEVKQIIHASSVAAYGIVEGHQLPLTEDMPRKFVDGFPYSAAKFQVEADLDEFEKKHPDIKVVRIRPAILIGSHLNNPLAWAFGKALDRGFLVAKHEIPMPVVWDEDVADGFILAMEKQAHGAFNMSAEPLNTAGEIARHLGLKVLYPGPMTNAFLSKLTRVRARLGSKTAVCPSWSEHDDIEISQSCAKARVELEWDPKHKSGTDVLEKYLECSPGKMDSRIKNFIKMLNLMGAQETVDPEHRHLTRDIHLCLTGRGGGDIWIHMENGKLSAKIGIPRPPQSVATLALKDWFRLINGEEALSTMMMTGKMRYEGDTSASFVLGGILTHLKQELERTGVRGRVTKTLSKLITRRMES